MPKLIFYLIIVFNRNEKVNFFICFFFLQLWEVYHERRCIRTYYGHRQAVRDICFNNDGTQFLSAGKYFDNFITLVPKEILYCYDSFTAYDRFIKLWDTETGACVSRFTSRKVSYCVKFNPEADKQHLFVAGTSDKKIICVSFNCYFNYL